jgi:hypothetical protein
MRAVRHLTNHAILFGAVLAVCLAFAPLASSKSAQSEAKSKDVYVCACMKTSSCPCKAMSNKAGKCPCGNDEMKAVARDSQWAKDNRKGLH